VSALLDAVVENLPALSGDHVEARATRLALLGRPNVGKSSLLNRLLGTEHALVAPEAGTTRDAVDTPVRIDGRPFVLIDTAGIGRPGAPRRGARAGGHRAERSGAVRPGCDGRDDRPGRAPRRSRLGSRSRSHPAGEQVGPHHGTPARRPEVPAAAPDVACGLRRPPAAV